MTFWYRLCWWICRIGLFFWHPVLHVHGRELVPAGCALLCANHSGMADPIWIMLALNSPKMIRILAKEELRHVQCFCQIAHTHLRFKQHEQNSYSCRIPKNLEQFRQII